MKKRRKSIRTRRFFAHLFLSFALFCFILSIFYSIVWWHFSIQLNCFTTPYGYSVCGKGPFLFIYQNQRLVSLLAYRYFFISELAIISMVSVGLVQLFLFVSVRSFNEEKIHLAFISILAFFELTLFWVVWLDSAGSTGGIFILRDVQVFFRESFVSQDYMMLIFLGDLAVMTFLRFNSARISLQLISLALLPLPVGIYFFDRVGEFNMHFESSIPQFYFLTNSTLLLVCAVTFVTATLYPHIVRLLGF